MLVAAAYEGRALFEPFAGALAEGGVLAGQGASLKVGRA